MSGLFKTSQRWVGSPLILVHILIVVNAEGLLADDRQVFAGRRQGRCLPGMLAEISTCASEGEYIGLIEVGTNLALQLAMQGKQMQRQVI